MMFDSIDLLAHFNVLIKEGLSMNAAWMMLSDHFFSWIVMVYKVPSYHVIDIIAGMRSTRLRWAK